MRERREDRIARLRNELTARADAVGIARFGTIRTDTAMLAAAARDPELRRLMAELAHATRWERAIANNRPFAARKNPDA
jgi:hypothetical protein